MVLILSKTTHKTALFIHPRLQDMPFWLFHCFAYLVRRLSTGFLPDRVLGAFDTKSIVDCFHVERKNLERDG